MTADRVPRRTAGLAGLLRERRLAAGLTQADLAARAGLAVRTVRELEQGRTVRPRRATALLIARTLRLTGQELAEFLAAARGDVESADPVVERAQPLVRLVGRDQELARLVDTLTDPDAGLVTLVGLAGVGKSALAAAVRQQVVGCFSGGVKSITVDPADPADALLARVSARFGATTPTQLAASLAGERALLVLDGAQAAPDQVRQAVAQLPSEVTVLVAARAPVGVPCEIVWPVPPLALPPASAACAPSDVRRYPAVAYFLERLTEVRREPPDGDEMAATVALVRRLDGIPSALEWAASHGRLLPVTEILRRYVDGTLDATPVQASVAASYRLLTPPQRRGLRRLAAFRDRWSLELAEQVLGGEVDPMSFLDRLASLGLVEVGGAMSGIRLWEVVRRFAVAHAQQRGEWAEARRIHASVIARAADHRAPRLPAPGTRAALTQLDRFRSDIWAALNYAANHEPLIALRLAAALPVWWRWRGQEAVGHRWLCRLLADGRTADADPALRARATIAAADLSGDPGEAAAVTQALGDVRRAGDVTGEVMARTVLRRLHQADGDYAAARAQAEAVLGVALRVGRWKDAAIAQLDLAQDACRIGDLAAAWRRLRSADRLAAQSGDRWLRLLAGAHRAEVARLSGRPEEALAIGDRVLTRLAEQDEPALRCRVLATIARALVAWGRTGDAERVATSLRSVGGPRAQVEGWRALVEAWLALGRGERTLAGERFIAAVAAFPARSELPPLVEALAGVAGCAVDDAARRRARDQLAHVVSEAGAVLLPQDVALCEAGDVGGVRIQARAAHPRRPPAP